jgi:hypothetical protein
MSTVEATTFPVTRWPVRNGAPGQFGYGASTAPLAINVSIRAVS